MTYVHMIYLFNLPMHNDMFKLQYIFVVNIILNKINANHTCIFAGTVYQ